MSKIRFVLVLSALALGPTVSGPPAQAAEGTRCTGTYVAVISPGFSITPTYGSFTSGGENGTIQCQDGRSGTIGVTGSYGAARRDDCIGGQEGGGVQSITLAGTKTIRNMATFSGGGLQHLILGGAFSGNYLSGSYWLTPIEGDCVSRPMTKVLLHFVAQLRD